MKQETDSTVDQQEINKFSQHANDWWNTQGPLKTLHDINEARLEFVAQHFELLGSALLDLGCGGGVFSEALAKAGATVTGIDAELEAIRIAKAHASSEQLSIEYQCILVEEFEHEVFDAITCMEMLEHVQNPSLVLEHCRRLLRPNGTLVLSTINRGVKSYASAVIAAEYVLGILPKQTHDYKKFIKPSELAVMARTAGFTLKKIQGLTYNPFTRQAHLSKDVGVNYLMVFT
jgi:2-polyprenyl-6-hydroxyphenyl methylase/3-demethylubiquinone-9 3-methyltransferase